MVSKLTKSKLKVSEDSYVAHVFFILLSIIFLVPLILLISVSFSSETSIIENGFKLIPAETSMEAYRFIFKNPDQIINSYFITTVITVIGTFIGMLIMLMCAYTLARKNFSYKKALSFFIFFTMLFNGGLVPTYILMTKYLHLRNTIWALIFSGMINVWHIFILRTFVQGISESIIESAIIDGASEFTVFLKIIVPLSKPSIATIGLFTLLRYWNAWMPALLYITDAQLYPLQYLLQKTLQSLQEVLKNMDKMPSIVGKDYKVPSESVRMAMAVVAAGPMLFILPFFQKYFVRGMTVGAVKG